MDTQQQKQEIKKITCDEVAWIIDILDRYDFVASKNFPAVSRIKKMAKYSAIYELMEILNLEFVDESARNNAMPKERIFNLNK